MSLVLMSPWLEDERSAGDGFLADALAAGLWHLASVMGTERIDVGVAAGTAGRCAEGTSRVH